ncbi:hypothetical protein LK533_03340 [Sphingomonas sp. PL-96]|uniref:hypothetical protein n=1 Tax=Sphingomonas sp. PL-96 TaxID=2887201 RepID=UPI001E3560B1|nr:hypothetical protein [Sphingomonas sp. PL-96]MCC2975709.1 hypothetical protein [Sphingomonas sp. PL-96]
MDTDDSSSTPKSSYFHCPSCGRPTTEELERCRHCKAVLRPGDQPNGSAAGDGFFARNFADEGAKGVIGCAVMALVPMFLLVGGVSYCSNQSAEKERIAAQEAAAQAKVDEERYQESVRTGQVCADGPNDAVTALELNVQRRLKDPGSYHHLGTVIRPAENGRGYDALMRYRSRNSFGGYVTGTVAAKLYLAERNVCEVASFDVID